MSLESVMMLYNRLAAIACAGIFIVYLSLSHSTTIVPVFAQINNTASDMTGSPTNGPPPIGGPNLILYTKSGGLAHLNQLYTFNLLRNELVFVDLNNNTIKKVILTDDDTSTLNDRFRRGDFSANETIYDINPCPDCFQYGLSLSFVHPDTRIEQNQFSFWTITTEGAEGHRELGRTIEYLATLQMTNANTTVASVR
jgi:hypothetical protein